MTPVIDAIAPQIVGPALTGVSKIEGAAVSSPSGLRPTLETFFQKFALFADAPDAVTKMRELVLHLAFNGQLVPSNAVRKVGSLESILAEASINGVSKGPTSDSTATEILRISAGTSRRDFLVNEDDFKHVDLPPDEVASASRRRAPPASWS
jgi:type I restriction enzyme S subunit